MPSAHATLNASDAARLQTVLDGIADEATVQRWSSLDQLRYFCDGADAMLLEAIGGKRFSTLSVLLQLLVQVSHDEKALGKEERKIGR